MENKDDMIQTLLEENEALRNRIEELEDELARKGRKNQPQKKRRTNKRDWLDSDDDDEY